MQQVLARGAMALRRIFRGASSSANPLVGFDRGLRGSVQQGSGHWMRADDRAEVDDAPAVWSGDSRDCSLSDESGGDVQQLVQDAHEG
jgi:hypothetical protein